MAQRGKPFPTYVDESGAVVLSATDKFVMVEGGQTVHLEFQDLQAALGGGGAIRVEDEGTSVVAAATALNFTGSGVTVTDGGSNEATVSISSGGSGANLAWVAGSSQVTSDSGTDATLTAVDGTNPGLMTVALKSKLDGIEAGADVTDATNVSAAGAPIISSGAGAPGSTPSKVGDIYIDTTGDNAYIAVGTASSADWEISNDGGGGGSGATVTSGAGAPASTPSAVGDIYIDTTADVAYMATGAASSADWQQGVAVATSTAGTWESRPQAQIVIWAAGTDTAATTPGAAVGDDIVILAEDADLTAIAALTSAANKVPYATGAGTWAMADFTAAGRALMDDADATAQRSTLGLGSAATTASTAYATSTQGATADSALQKVAAGASVENIGAVEWNVNTVGTSGATETLDTSTYGVHKVTMDQACTFTFSNPAPSGKETEFKLYLSGAFTPTFPAAVDWAGGTPPTYATPGIYVFSTTDAGTTWLGSSVGQGFA